ncbi:MAG TPA: hypothetical protein VMU97_02510 [Candidatus Dormibacteraeota bacterium]|nr:hypothetical protein [Candidatus Dormibacteraeota bacterium]
MKTFSRQDKSAGFAIVETLLVLIILAAIVGVGAYVVRQKHNANSTLGSTGGTATSVKAPSGTTTGIDQLTQQDAQTEAGIDSAADSGAQQSATSANSAVNNVGGAYNETNL